MRSSNLWRAFALLAALALVGPAGSQPPTRSKGPLGGLGIPAPSVDDVVERIMSFDKNKDGKVTKDELPERMHHLIARGDTNKDGALDRDEVRKLASSPGFFGGPQVRVTGPGPGAPGGGIGFGRGFGFGPGTDHMVRVVDDLKLPAKKKDQALAVVKAHQEAVRKMTEQARADMLLKMKGVLSEEELKDFQAALDRPGGDAQVFFEPGGPPPPRRTFGPAGAPSPREMEQTIDRLQKEVEELRRKLRR